MFLHSLLIRRCRITGHKKDIEGNVRMAYEIRSNLLTISAATSFWVSMIESELASSL